MTRERKRKEARREEKEEEEEGKERREGERESQGSAYPLISKGHLEDKSQILCCMRIAWGLYLKMQISQFHPPDSPIQPVWSTA